MWVCYVLPDALTDDSLPGETEFLHEIFLDDNQQPTLSSPVRVLDEGIEVSGVVLLSAGSLCAIDQIRANVSIISPLTGKQSRKGTLIPLPLFFSRLLTLIMLYIIKSPK